jgi:high-affinity Fe2+/Pb2+ permease
MSYLVNEILLRLAKAVVALLLGLALYVLLTSVGGATGSIELGLLCFLAAAAFILLVQESPI